MSRGALLTLFIFLALVSGAQHGAVCGDFYLKSPARKVFHVNGKEDGLMVLHELGPGKFAIYHLDSNLIQIKSDTLRGDRLRNPVFGVYSPLNRRYLIIIPLSFNEVQIFQYDCKTSDITQHYMKLPPGMRVSDSCPVICQNRLMWYTEKDSRIRLFSADLDSFHVRMLPYEFPHRENRIISFQSLEDRILGMAVLTDCFGADRIHYLTVLDTGGVELFKPVFADLDQYRQPYIWHGARFRVLSPAEVRVIGWWGQSRLSAANQGFFYIRLRTGEPTGQVYTPFTSLPRFYAFMGQGGEKRMDRKRSKKAERGKVLKWNGDGIFAGEDLFRDQWLVDFDMLSYWNANSVFPDTRFGVAEYRNYARAIYEYSHSMVLLLDSAGRLIRDYCIPHDQVYDRLSEPERYSVAFHDTLTGKLRYIYTNRSWIYRYTLGDHIDADLDTLKPPTGYQQSWLRSEKTTVAYWHSGRYLVWGLQRVKRRGGFPGTRWIYRYAAFRD